MPDIFLKNTSYELASGEWTPRVLVRTFTSEGIKEQEFTWDKLSTKEEAEAFAEIRITEMKNDI